MILDVLQQRILRGEDASISMGYWFTTAPQYHNGVLYIGSTRSESHIPGGHVLAVDAKTGKVLWHFNTIPQDEKDQGWDIAGPTWVGGERNGGGIWETAAIDPELGLLYVAVGNPFGDSTKRAGTNLFTDSIIALTLDTGRLKWHFQQTHHDVWDYDSGAPPMLFDMQVNGRRVKALAEASKNGFLLHPRPRDGTAGASNQGDARADRQRRSRASRRGRRSRFRSPPSGKPMEPVAPIERARDSRRRNIGDTNADRARSSARCGRTKSSAPGTGRRHQLQPVSRTAPQTGFCTSTPSISPSTRRRGPKGYFSAYDPTTGRIEVAADLRGLRSGWFSGHG